IAEKMELPLLYVRASQKSHGMENLIEGDISVGKRVVVVEDLVSTGGSSLNAVSALREAGLEVLGMTAIFTYGFPLATDNFRKSGIPLHTLGNYHDLIEQAVETGYIRSEQLESLNNWRKDPAGWKPDSQ
ncbi:orotate phosphoribosyltransferase, partial [Bacteroidota bacterium]